jgi:Pretoxin HINT domain
MLALVACSALLAVTGPDAPTPEVSQAYQEARAGAGKSSEDQVRLALWCEAHGLTKERLNHLALAVLTDPANATARGLMGLVAYDGRFRRPEAVAEKAQLDPTLAEYNAKRSKAPYTAEGQWAMGVWADEHGLRDQAKAHFTAVTRLDPSREHAWKRLAYKRHGARWMTDAQADAEKAEADAQKQADKTWRPLIDKYRAMLDQPAGRDEAESALSAITDPRAVPSILGTFAFGRHPDPLRAVQLLGQIDSPSASKALAALAVFPKAPAVRRAAVETLQRRDPRDFVSLWIALIRKPTRYEIKPVKGPGSPGELFVEGQKANLRRVYSPPPLPNIAILPGMTLDTDANGLPVLVRDLGTRSTTRERLSGAEVLEREADRQESNANLLQLVERLPASPINRALARSVVASVLNQADPLRDIPEGNLAQAQLRPLTRYVPIRNDQLRIPVGQMIVEAEKAAAVARRQLADDVASIERANAAVRKSNEPVLLALSEVTGKDMGIDGAAWGRWWADNQGYALATDRTSSAPTVVEDVPIAYTPQAGPTIVPGPVVGYRVSNSCFAAGTTVRTIEGDRAIESIRPGDLVLAQDPKIGTLTYQPVVAVFHNPPSATLRVQLGDDTVVATGIHRFWKAGRGWTMARELKPGDPIRTLGGVAKVESVEEEKVQPVFNLEVAEGHSFLVGKLGALVHDNSLVEPVLAPFDAPTVALAVKPAR